MSCNCFLKFFVTGKTLAQKERWIFMAASAALSGLSYVFVPLPTTLWITLFPAFLFGVFSVHWSTGKPLLTIVLYIVIFHIQLLEHVCIKSPNMSNLYCNVHLVMECVGVISITYSAISLMLLWIYVSTESWMHEIGYITTLRLQLECMVTLTVQEVTSSFGFHTLERIHLCSLR